MRDAVKEQEEEEEEEGEDSSVTVVSFQVRVNGLNDTIASLQV